ncbi:TonB-dependent receptor plug domain-containing protein [Mucilaginibacter sp. P19]|uniref:TonB-dependent receptor plug domain-containing protein n=1 Tax=Mucilaginibacter sp. P19 TaxID=3423947 RepID=UPI003D6753E0
MYKFYPKSKARIPLRAIQGLRIMKTIIILTIFTILQASAYTKAQNVSLTEKNAPLKKVFLDINKQTGYDFLASNSVLKSAKPVTIDVKNQPLKVVLDEIFIGQSLGYILQEKMVIVTLKPNAITAIEQSVATPVIVTGKVTDTLDNPLPGATLKIKTSNKIALTNPDGTFTIGANEGDEIEVSFIGFRSTSFIAHSEATALKVTLHANPSKLNEIQVIGYGKVSKRLNTGSVSTLSAVEIEKQPVTNVLSALSGKAAGVFVQTTNGLPGGGISVQIRGKGSILAGTDPLYIIDDVPFSTTLMNANSGIGSSAINGLVSPLNSINPDDIESISILKDADATAIYGSRASNGVVLITTKKGKAGKTKVDLNLSQGVNTTASEPRLLDLQQYLEISSGGF